ncbi:MAG TPA: MlaD family protein [Azonexus sp.]|nr:MlaD family protein [Azonexus sp.]
MDSKVNYVAVGVFVIVLGCALIAGVLWLAAGAGGRKHFDPYMAVINESVSGLNVDAPVKYLGVDVGKVREIRLQPGNPELVQLFFAIERGTPIKQDTVATLKIQGLTGIAYVELSGGRPDSPPLVATTPGQPPVIRTKPSLSARLENVLTRGLASLDRTSANVNAVLDDDNRAAFKSALADIARVAHALSEQRDALNAGIGNLAQTADHTAQATQQLESVIRRIGTSADAVEKMADNVKQTSTTTGQTIDAMGAGVKHFTGETLPEMERLLGELSDLSLALRRLSEQTERNPSGLLLGRQPVPAGPGE